MADRRDNRDGDLDPMASILDQEPERLARHAVEGRLQIGITEAVHRLEIEVQKIQNQQADHAKTTESLANSLAVLTQSQLALTKGQDDVTKTITKIEKWLIGSTDESGNVTAGVMQTVGEIKNWKKWVRLGVGGIITTALAALTNAYINISHAAAAAGQAGHP